MENVIKKAIEGGYKKEVLLVDVAIENLLKSDLPFPVLQANVLLLDPLFWQALGRAEGWQDKDFPAVCPFDCDECGHNEDLEEIIIPWWRHIWHCFIDHLAEGKPVDDFFNNLLK